jgi:hypothetical protein
MADGTKVTMTSDSWKLKKGQTVSVDKATADRLVTDGHAVRETGKKSS